MSRKPPKPILALGFAGSYDAWAERVAGLHFEPVRAESREQGERALKDAPRPIRALVVPSSRVSEPLAEELAALRAAAPSRLRGAVVGPRPSHLEVKGFRAAGFEYGAFDPCTDSELRCVLNLTLYDPGGWKSRTEMRVPTPLQARISARGREKTARLYTLSLSGAFLATERPLMDGASLRVEVPLPSGPVTLQARVVWSNVPGNLLQPNTPLGMGVHFVRVPAEEGEAIAFYVDERERSYRL